MTSLSLIFSENCNVQGYKMNISVLPEKLSYDHTCGQGWAPASTASTGEPEPENPAVFPVQPGIFRTVSPVELDNRVPITACGTKD